MPLAGHGLRPTPLRRRAGRPQLKRDPLGSGHQGCPLESAVADRAPVAPIVLGGMLSVVAFDAVGSLASRQFGFSYGILIVGSLLIYGTIAALVARRRDWHTGLFAAIAMALTDLTFGWAVSWLIGPGRPAGGLTTTTVMGAALTALLAAGVAGSIGGWVGVRRPLPGAGPGTAA